MLKAANIFMKKETALTNAKIKIARKIIRLSRVGDVHDANAIAPTLFSEKPNKDKLSILKSPINSEGDHMSTKNDLNVFD